MNSDVRTATAALIERLEKATGADRGLDICISLAITDQQVMVDGGGYKPNQRPVVYKSAREIWNDEWPYWSDALQVRDVGILLNVPSYTASVDAALTLVPAGWRTNWAGQVPMAKQWFWELAAMQENRVTDRVWAPTAPLAICITALKATGEAPR